MSVLSHLSEVANSIKILDGERNAIDTSINNLANKLDSYFPTTIQTKFVFGSYDRKTILRRSKDSQSDVDYMIVFNDADSYTPQTLMNRLKNFAIAKYSSSEIYQSSPTVVLELNHIKFELAPAKKDWLGLLYIPAPASNYQNWIHTDPASVKTNLNTKNQSCNYQIRKLVRILKYWNVLNGRPYSSYTLEKYVIDKNFWFCTNLKEYFYQAVEGLSTLGLSISNTSKVNSLKDTVNKTKRYEADAMPITAELELKKAIP